MARHEEESDLEIRSTSLHYVCLKRDSTAAVLRIPTMGADPTIGDLRESAIRDLEALLESLRAGGSLMSAHSLRSSGPFLFLLLLALPN